MKKYLSLLLTFALLLTLSAPAFAAVTDTFVDEIPADTANFLPQVVEFSSVGDDPNNSHKMAVESNPDLGETLLLKAAAPRDPKWSEYIVYKMDKNICGFKLDVVCCAGLGNPLEDITVFLSKNGTDWNEVSTQATKYVYNEDIYINFDKAYWHNSTLTNKKKIGTGYKYIKIQLNGCTEANDVPWNIAIDTVTVYMGSNEPAPTISAEDKFETYEQINATRTTKGTESTTSTTASTQGTTAPSKTNTPSKTNGTTTASKTNAPSKTNGTTAPTKTNTPTKTDGTTAPTKAPTGNGPAITTTNTPDTTPTDAPVASNPGDPTDAPVNTDPTTPIGGDSTTPTSGDSTAPADGDSTAPSDGDSTDGDVADPTAPVNGDGQDVSGDKDDDNGSNAWIWIVVAVVVLAGAGVGVFFFLRKKTNS